MPYVSCIYIFEFIQVKLRFDGKTISESHWTTYDHPSINHLASYRGEPLTVGGSGSAKTEILDIKCVKWNPGPDYPFHK